MWSKGTLAALLIFACTLPVVAATETTGKARLRELAGMPSLNFDFGYNLDTLNGFTSIGESSDPTDEIAAVLKQMDGGPDDAGRYHHLAQLYETAKDGEKYTNALNKSVALYRRQVETQPENGPLLANYGEALSDVDGRNAEAEHYLRQAVQLASNDWHTWHCLGSFLQSRALSVFNHDPAVSPDSSESSPSAKPTFAQLDAAQDAMKEAMNCFDREIACAPGHSDSYVSRAAARMAVSSFRLRVARAHGADIDEKKIITAGFAGDGLDDLKAAARVDPKNYRAMVLIAMWECYRASLQSPRPLESFSDDTLQVVREQTAALHKLEDDPDKHLAAGALEAEGFLLYVFLHDPTGAEKTFRRALDMDLSRERAGAALAVLLGDAKHYDEMVAVCQQMLKHRETPQNLLYVARASQYASHLDQTESALRRAIAIAPGNVIAQLGFAGMLMKHTDDNSLIEASEHIRSARTALEKLPDSKETDELQTDYLFTAGICQGLAGNTEQAREAFRHVLERDPNNDDAKEALKALDN